MKTFGEFFDSVVVRTHKDSIFLDGFFLEEWKGMVSPEKWREVREMELTEELFLAFTEDMATKYQERLRGICTDEMYILTLKNGHEFLRMIASVGQLHGLTVPLNRVDIPLSPSDAIVMAHHARQQKNA